MHRLLLATLLRGKAGNYSGCIRQFGVIFVFGEYILEENNKLGERFSGGLHGSVGGCRGKG